MFSICQSFSLGCGAGLILNQSKVLRSIVNEDLQCIFVHVLCLCNSCFLISILFYDAVKGRDRCARLWKNAGLKHVLLFNKDYNENNKTLTGIFKITSWL